MNEVVIFEKVMLRFFTIKLPVPLLLTSLYSTDSVEI